MPYDDPRWMGGIGMIGTKAVYNAVMHCDLLLMLGTDYPYSEFPAAQGRLSIQVDERAQRARAARADRARRRRLGAADPEAVARQGRRQERHGRFWDKVTQERRKWDEMLDKQADPARSKDRIHPQAVARAVSDLASARRGLRPRYRAEHAVVGKLDPPERIAADHRLVQQCRRRNGARPGQRHPGARSLAPGHRAVRRRRFQHADVRIPDRGASQAARQGHSLQQFRIRAHSAGGREPSGFLPYREGDRIPQSGFRGVRARLRRPWISAPQARASCTAAIDEALRSMARRSSMASSRPTRCRTFRISSWRQVGHYAVAKIKEAVLAVTGP